MQKLFTGVEEIVGSGVCGGGGGVWRVIWDALNTIFFLFFLNHRKKCCRRFHLCIPKHGEKNPIPLLAHNVLSHGLCGMVTRKMEQWNLNVFQPPVGNS